jgi:hypothetical protein
LKTTCGNWTFVVLADIDVNTFKVLADKIRTEKSQKENPDDVDT